MVDKDWSKEWDKRDKQKAPVSRDYRHFIGGWICGGFSIFAIIVLFDGIMRWLYA